MLPLSLLLRWLAQEGLTFYQRAFTPLITLWYLVFQRLNPNHALSAVQEDARSGGADALSAHGKKLSRQLRSEATASFSDARQRLPLGLCHRVLRHTAAHTHKCLQVPLHFGLKLGLLDGSTFRSRPLGDIAQEFPPHRPGNCKKDPYWCITRVVGLLCWATGVVIDTALGPSQSSEQALAAQLLAQQSWKGWLLVADRNFGVYSMARAISAGLGHGLLRLTEVRARRLARSAGVRLKPGLDVCIHWEPTSQDKYPPNLEPTAVAGRLLAVRVSPPGYRSFILYLFTTLTDPVQCPSESLAQTYALRWQIELSFRYIKAQMGLGFLESHSAAMLRKEWVAGLIAYNLICWTMSTAAALAKMPVRCLSFSRARELILGWYLRHTQDPRPSSSWQHLLERIAKARLPLRRKKRPSEPRAIRPFSKYFAKLEGSRADMRKHLRKIAAKS